METIQGYDTPFDGDDFDQDNYDDHIDGIIHKNK